MSESSQSRGRGADFENRFNASRWAENLLFQEINKLGPYLLIRYGASFSSDSKYVDLGDITIKEPDLLLYLKEELTQTELEWLVSNDLSVPAGGSVSKPSFVLSKARLAFEVEFSPYRASEMKERYKIPRLIPSNRNIPKTLPVPVAPNIFVKDEDLGRLEKWSALNCVPIIVAHIFDQEAFLFPLAGILEFRTIFVTLDRRGQFNLQRGLGVFFKEQNYGRVDAEQAAERKWVYCIHPLASLKLADVVEVEIGAQWALSSGKKYVSNVVFSNGSLSFDPLFLDLLGSDSLPAWRPQSFRHLSPADKLLL
ncbi:hypothetical protein [Roseococcus suduntuyensis]|uniref:Uncharacterized protein n=1 Tax=Roseococcus suduntuyensis TaxID=455361 RepID=A0A840A3X2_9PROT|nr:hypothetical protein [Roseococcus suduntuyensis]MBB3896608.1 hypothetical protein [Roseococcus suduntuyensis]